MVYEMRCGTGHVVVSEDGSGKMVISLSRQEVSALHAGGHLSPVPLPRRRSLPLPPPQRTARRVRPVRLEAI